MYLTSAGLLWKQMYNVRSIGGVFRAMQIAIMSNFKRFLCVGTASIALASPASAQFWTTVPPHGKLVPLFNGKDLHGFDTLLEKHGMNNDPERVFQVEKGMLHISGLEFGGLVTQKEY